MSGIEKHRETLAMLFNEADRLYQELSAFSDRLFDSGLDETSCSLGVDDALKALGRTMGDLERRIEFTNEAIKG